MDTVLSLLYTILTLLFFIAFGYYIKIRGTLSPQGIADFNTFVFHFCFPLGIAMGFYGADIKTLLNPIFFKYLCVMFALNILLALLVGKLLHRDKLSQIVTATAIFRGAFIVMGYPILSALYGPSSIALIGIIVAFSQMFYNLLTTYLYESALASKTKFTLILLQVLKSPMVLGVFVGIFINLLHVNLGFLEKPFRTIASMGSPLALLVLGYGLEFKFNPRYIKNTLLVTVIKLLLLPLIAMVLTRFIPLSSLERAVVIVLFGAPSSVNVYTFAKTYHGNEELAQDYVLFTTILYALSIYLVLFML